VRELTLRAMREDRGRFAGLRGERAFMYWPHGLGDWVHLAAILPLFEPSNAYAIARFGDDYSCILENNRYVRVLGSGCRALGDGGDLGAKHLGLELRRLDGRPRTVRVPEPLGRELEAFAPTALLWSDYPETEGRTAFPFHTKARHLANLLVGRERLQTFDLAKPLPSTIEFQAPGAVQTLVDERLRRLAGPQTRCYVLSIAGYTAERKNWDPSQARTLVRLLQRDDPRARVIAMDDPQLGDASAWEGRDIVTGYRELFADIDAPFARVFLALLARTAGFAGVPAGPLHAAMARGGFPIVGLWLAHLPEWYDEPNPGAVHFIGSYVRERRFDRRPATRTLPDGWHRKIQLDSNAIPAEAVYESLRSPR
jgi:hypothetical protein